MTTDTVPPAEETIELEIPGDVYVGLNVVRKHIAEFFYRAGTAGLLGAGESVLAIFDCVLLEPSGRRLGGLTLHDYAVLTDQHLITWGRGLNRDVIDKFEWSNITLDKFGRRTPIEGVIKVAYNIKSSGTKRRIAIKGAQTDPELTAAVEEVAALDPAAGVVIYLDLMPIGDVRICAGMMHYLMNNGGNTPDLNSFKEHFRADIGRSQQRMATVNSLMRPFYMDLGNGMLVEADTVQDLRAVRSSPYRGPASPYRNVGTPYRSPGVNVNRGDASAAALNRGGRNTDTMRGNTEGKEESGSGLRETVRLNQGTIDRPSKLEDYENRAAGRPTRGSGSSAPSRLGSSSGESRLTRTSETGESAPPARAAGVYNRPAPAPRPAPVSRPAPPPRPARPMAASRPVRVAAARPVRAEQQIPRAGEVLNETSVPASAGYAERPIVMPITVAISRALLNPYSLSRLARGLWIDPRNLVRNLGDISQTTGALADIAEVVTTDEEARTVAVNRVRASAYSVFRDNIILHYTVWPFVKPLLDLVLLPVEGDLNLGRRARLRVRTAEGVDIEAGDTGLDDMGAMTASDMTSTKPKAEPVMVHVVEATPPVVSSPPPVSTPPATIAPAADAPLNTSGKSSIDPTSATSAIPDVPAPPSKLGDNFGPDEGGNGKKIGFKK